MLDFDLAELYGSETKRLKEAVRRNIKRFPPDFMFELTKEELSCLRTQFATSNKRGGTRYMPFPLPNWNSSTRPSPNCKRRSASPISPETPSAS